MKIVLFGTPRFAVECFKEIIDTEHEIALIVTQPDKRSGRSSKLFPPPMKLFADQLGIRCIQPKPKDPELLNEIRSAQPDVCLVVAYGQFIGSSILSIAKYGFINLHASLLPKYRGAAPVNWSLINGEKRTGLTTFFLEKEMDAGKMILKAEIEIEPNDTATSLLEKMIQPGKQLLTQSLEEIVRKDFKSIPQDHVKASFAPKLTKELGHIQSFKLAQEVFDRWRGLQPWPGIHSFIELKGLNKKIEWMELSITQISSSIEGQLIEKEGQLYIGCGDFLIQVNKLRLEGKKESMSQEFINGYQFLFKTSCPCF